MSESARLIQPNEYLAELSRILESGTFSSAKRLMNALHPADIADLLESLPHSQRILLWELVNDEVEGDVLLEVGDEVRESLIRTMDVDEIRAATEKLDLDDLADFVQSLPEKLIEETLHGMDKQNRQRLETVLSYDEDSAGGLMNLDAVTVRADVTLDVVLRYLRRMQDLPEHTDRLIVVDRYDQYVGVLGIRRLLTHDPERSVADLMRTDVKPVLADTPAQQVARLFEDHDLISAPVIDADGRLLGRITVDDVLDVIRDEAEQSLLSMAGLNQEDDIFSPPVRSARRRAIWLGVNLATAFLAAWVIGLFQATLEEVVALAILMPIVASMGGIAGSQTLTLVIRGQALGQVGRANTRWLLSKELWVALLNGVIWSSVVAAIAYAWFGDAKIGLIIAAAMLINLLFAALSGVLIPLILRSLRLDPALAGGVVLTTVTDVVGFVAFLGLATLFLLG
ncbi:MAG: magnesium transporter [Pseudomonadota bacterium]